MACCDKVKHCGGLLSTPIRNPYSENRKREIVIVYGELSEFFKHPYVSEFSDSSNYSVYSLAFARSSLARHVLHTCFIYITCISM
ncbi:hypothetical protein P70_0081 [Listeria phage P70]|uniref:Uncharacterized protein n=1 Tax=Listeria phage P70 TaxID=1225800 RepID=J9QRW7_9CAUD|nr:hypothetical protein P70_0081 [Listeria phage P70]AFQ96270.1 hypothetical protein P70_0081 [Listeria phage P70]